MAKYRLDYIWLDGYTPVQNLRTKCMLRDFDEFPTLDQLPEWGFDGSSTQQAEGGDSDCVLKPVALYPDGTREDGILVMCEVMLSRRQRSPIQRSCYHSLTMKELGSALSRNTSSCKKVCLSASPKADTPTTG